MFNNKSMITKEQFKELIESYLRQDDLIRDIEDASGLDLFASEFIEYGFKLFENVIDLLFKDEGSDIVFWWIYERMGHPEIAYKDKEGNVHPSETLDDLWEIIKEFIA